MAVEINDLGNGSGYLYITDASDNILTAEINTPQGYRNIRGSGLTVAPIAARKSSVGTITVTSASGAGTIDDITVDGISQIASSISITSSTPSDVAIDIASYINAYTPSSGYDYTAVSNGAVVDIIGPDSVGSDPNGYVVAITKTSASTFTTTNMSGGSSNNGIIDDVLGLKFYMNSDPSATPTSLTGAVEVTKYLVTRGLQTGMVVADIRIDTDGVYDADRASCFTLINVTPESGTSDVLAYIDPVGFIEGDVVMIRSAVDTNTIIVESAPVSTSTAPIKNIYLAGDLAFTADNYQTLTLQYRYIDTFGACFVEANRSLSIGNSFNLYNTDGTLTNTRVLSGNSYNLTFEDVNNLIFGGTNYVKLVNTTSPTSYVIVYNNHIDRSSAAINEYATDFTATIDNDLILDAGHGARFGTSAAGVIARVTANAGVIAIDVSSGIHLRLNGVTLYKMPLTTPTTGQVLTALDNAGTLGWA